MSAEVLRIVQQLMDLAQPSAQAVAVVLGCEARLTDEGAWNEHGLSFSGGIFTEGAFKQSVAEPHRALLWVDISPEAGLSETSFELEQHYGPRWTTTINPHMFPEGTFSEVFRTGGVQVSFRFTYETKVFSLLALEWGAYSPP